MKNAFIAALVAAVVAATSATAASIVITSKNIENGTIQTIDISAKAKRALKGQSGLRGLTGPSGVPGATGPAGARGTNGADGAPGATGPEGPKGDKGDRGEPGAEALWAVVDDAPPATLRRGKGAVSATLDVGGEVRVTFNRDVRMCAYGASIGSHEPSSTAPGIAITRLGVAPTDIVVATATPAGTPSPFPFHLVVFC